jgi:dihydroorotate dehydrogenase
LLTKPWFLLPTQVAHDIAPFFLRAYGKMRGPKTFTWEPREWRGLKFSNPLGIAGGVDKNAEQLRGWWALGAGFLEIGTVTPLAQGPNPGQIMARDISHQALWNKMGFPGKGAVVALQNLRAAKPYHTPIFVNVGKNRATPNELAHQDYEKCMRSLAEVADVFVVNLSSPNTKGLRELLQPQNLKKFLDSTLTARSGKPVLLKLSPDMSETEIRTTLDTAIQAGIDGFVLTNTTLSRENYMRFSDEGGVSGAPLRALSEKALTVAVNHLGKKRDQLLVSVGGVMNAQDVWQRLEIGADLVQVYSALIFTGPSFFKQVTQARRQI